MRDAAALNFRVGNDGEIYFLSTTALPGFEPDSTLMTATRAIGVDYDATILAVLKAAAARNGLLAQLDATEAAGALAPARRSRSVSAFNMKAIRN